MTVLAGGGAAQTGLLAQPGIIAFFIVFGMALVLFFVFRSMSKHLRKVNQLARDEEDAQAAMASGEPKAGAPSNQPASG